MLIFTFLLQIVTCLFAVSLAYKIGRLLLDVKTEELYLSFHIPLFFLTLSPRKILMGAVFAAFLICPVIIVWEVV